MDNTLKNMLKTAILPIGKAMYIYGGGWNAENTGAAEEACSLGISNKWTEFYKKQNADYNHKKYSVTEHPCLIHCGIDCSAYVGWVVYNLFENENGKNGYVYPSEQIARQLAEIGFGSYKTKYEIEDYMPGDIMGGEGYPHTWICIGQMEDKSVVLVHSSPPAPMLSGTETPDGKYSLAIELAEHYMKKYYPSHYSKYPIVSREKAYLEDFGQFRFYDDILTDPEGLKHMPPEDLLKLLFA